jgi:hypothetical protein
MKDSLDYSREAKTLEEMDQLNYFLMQTSETYNKCRSNIDLFLTQTQNDID